MYSKSKEGRKRKYWSPAGDADEPKRRFHEFDDEARAEEERLTELLFGDSSGLLHSLHEAERQPAAPTADSGVGETEEEDDDTSSEDKDQRKPAWTDEDDDGIEVGRALCSQGRKLPAGGPNKSAKYSALVRHKFQSIVGNPKWSELNHQPEEEGSDDELLRTTGHLTKAKRLSMSPTVLEFKKIKDLNAETYSEGPAITSVEFHPSSTVAMVAGVAGIASLFAVSGEHSNKLHSIGLEAFPIECGRFCRGGSEAVFGSRRPYMYSFDLMTAKTQRLTMPPKLSQLKHFVVSPDDKLIAVAGKWGEVHLLEAASKELTFSLKQESDVTALAFSPDSKTLLGHSSSGEITVWDVGSQRVRHRFADEGCLHGTALHVSPSGQYLATGSRQGVVNVYDVADVMTGRSPSPMKAALNLTTSIDHVLFNPTSETLAFCSSALSNCVRLLNLSSGTVYSNFPGWGSRLGRIMNVAFSPGSGFMALGTKTSKVPLFRLRHFSNY